MHTKHTAIYTMILNSGQKQMPCKNQFGTGKEGGSVQSDAKVQEAVQCPTGAHMPLVIVDF